MRLGVGRRSTAASGRCARPAASSRLFNAPTRDLWPSTWPTDSFIDVPGFLRRAEGSRVHGPHGAVPGHPPVRLTGVVLRNLPDPQAKSLVTSTPGVRLAWLAMSLRNPSHALQGSEAALVTPPEPVRTDDHRPRPVHGGLLSGCASNGANSEGPGPKTHTRGVGCCLVSRSRCRVCPTRFG